VTEAPPPRPSFADGLSVMGRGIRDEPVLFTWSVIGSIVFAAGLAAGGFVLGRISDTIIADAYRAGRADARQILTATTALAAVALLTTVGVVVRRVVATILTFRLQARYRRQVAERLLVLPLAWHRRHPAGQLLSIANSDAEAAFAVFAPLPFAIGVIALIGISAVLMLLADWVLALVALSAIPVLFTVNIFYQRRMSVRVARAQQLRAEVSDVAHETFDGAVTVKALGAEAAQAHHFSARAEQLRHANVAVGRGRSVFEPIIELLPAMASLAVLAVGAVRVDQGSAAIGDVVQVAYLLAILAFPVRAFGWVLAEMPRSVIGWRRVATVLDAQGDPPAGSADLPDDGPLELRAAALDVDVVDPDGSLHRLLHGVDVVAAPGRVIAVVGSTGAGKTTLAAALLRLLDPAGGLVEVAGTDLRELRSGALAAAVGYVPQTVFVFDDSIGDNVSLGRPLPGGTGRDAVWSALELARLADFVRSLPGGLDTEVGERGATLSGGQRQRLGIARAVATRPRVLVLDDATSALDATVEAEVLGGLRHAWPVTVLVVAYRLSTIRLADSVVHLQHGRVVDAGGHEELLSRDEGYRTLVEAYARQAADRAAELGATAPSQVTS